MVFSIGLVWIASGECVVRVADKRRPFIFFFFFQNRKRLVRYRGSKGIARGLFVSVPRLKRWGQGYFKKINYDIGQLQNSGFV